MKRLVSVLLLFGSVLTLCACTQTEKVEGTSYEPLPEDAPASIIHTQEDLENYLAAEGAVHETLVVSTEANARPFNALGTEWDPHFFREYNSTCTEEDWELIKSRIQKLNLQKVRVMIQPTWYEPDNDDGDAATTDYANFAFDSDSFASIYRELEVCEELGISVNLTVWGAIAGSWMGYTVEECTDWISVPKDFDEFAENVSALLGYLINEKHLTCIDELTLYNEPNWAYKGLGGDVDFSSYASLCRVVHERLQKDGLRDKIKMILSDDVDGSLWWLTSSITNMNDFADGYASHCYAFNEQNKYKSMLKWFTGHTDVIKELAADKQFTINELGSSCTVGAYVQTDVDDYERGVMLANLTAGALNAGCDGLLYWGLHDVRYNGSSERDESLMQTCLFAYKDENWRIRPCYHAWGLLMNYCLPGSSVYSVTSATRVCATTLRTDSGDWTYVVSNDNSEPRVITVQNDNASDLRLEVYVYSEGTVTESDDMIKSSGVALTQGNETHIYLPARSFAVLSTIQK